MPVTVDNDANMAALAEHRAGAARGTSEAVIMTIGTGIGGGLILAASCTAVRSARPASWATW